MTSPRLQILERQMARRQTPERIPVAPEDDLSAAIQRLVDQRVEQALEERPVKPPAHVQRLMDDFNKPTHVVSRELPPVPKTAPVIESVVSQRDARGRIAKMITRPTQGDGPVFETVVAQRDEFGRIVRLVNTQIDAAPDPGALGV